LEVSLLGVIATESRRAVALDATQRPPGLSTDATGSDYSRIDFYLEQPTDGLGYLTEVRYWVGDGYYAKRKVFNTLSVHGKDLITKLRSDANLRFVKAPHRRRYGSKVRYCDFAAPDSGFDSVGVLEDLPHVRIYTALVNSEHFKRDLRLVVLHNERDESCMVLCSTDLEQASDEIVAFYRLRYQLEFIIRDAKQHLGLSQCQARDQAKLDFHLNASVAAVNLGRLVSERLSLSLESLLRECYNTFLVRRLLSELGLEAEFGLTDPVVAQVLRVGPIGRMAA
jgi:hypothetical protein